MIALKSVIFDSNKSNLFNKKSGESLVLYVNMSIFILLCYFFLQNIFVRVFDYVNLYVLFLVHACTEKNTIACIVLFTNLNKSSTLKLHWMVMVILWRIIETLSEFHLTWCRTPILKSEPYNYTLIKKIQIVVAMSHRVNL